MKKLLFTLICGLLAAGCYDNKTQQEIKQPEEVVAIPKRQLDKQEVIQAYSDYAVQLNGVISEADLSTSEFIKAGTRHIKLGELNYASSKLGLAKGVLQRAQDQLMHQEPLELDGEISDEDGEYFNNLQELALNVLSAQLVVVFDLLEMTRFGGEDSQFSNDVKTVLTNKKKFEVAIYDGYKHFGVDKKSINRDFSVASKK